MSIFNQTYLLTKRYNLLWFIWEVGCETHFHLYKGAKARL